MSGTAFGGHNQSAARWFAGSPTWWNDHYVGAVDQVVDFLAGDGISLSGKRLLDVGCGDGIVALGLANRSGAASILAVDLEEVDDRWLRDQAAEHGVNATNERLRFAVSEPASLPCPTGSVDVVVAWSVFEHVHDVRALLTEIHRVLTQDGVFFIQIWPLYFSEHGSHLWPWFDQSFAHLRLPEAELRHAVELRTNSAPLAHSMLDLFDSCNRITVDQLGQELIAANFRIGKVELLSNAIHVPDEIQSLPLTQLAVSGVKLLVGKR